MFASPWRLFLPVPVLFLAALRVLAPGVVAGDCGELVTAAQALGPGHPPGYPLWVLLGRLFALLPLGSTAFRVGLLTVLALALSYPFLARALERILEKSKPGFRGGSLLAGGLAFFVITNPLVLSQAQGAEVYGLLFFLSALLLWGMTREGAAPPLIFFTTGLLFAHHYLVVVALPALLVSLGGRLKNPKTLARGFALALLGLSPILALVLRSRLDPVVDWGNPDNFVRFWKHLIRTQYTGMGSTEILTGVHNLIHYGGLFLRETWGGGLLLLAGVARWRGVGVWWIAAGMQLVVLPFMLLIEQNPVSYAVIDAFFPPAFLWSAPLLVLGAARLFDLVRRSVARRAVVLAGMILVVAHAVWGLSQADASRNLAMERMARNVLLALPRDAALYSRGDSPTFALFYLKAVEGMRPDVIVTDRTGGTFRDAYHLQGRQVPDLYRTLTRLEQSWDLARPDRRSYYTESNGVPGRELTPFGLLFAVGAGEGREREREYWRRAVPPAATTRDEFFTRSEGGTFHLLRGWWRLREGDTAGARREFARLREIAGQDNRLLTFLSTIYLNQGWRREAEQVCRDVLEFAPKNVGALFQLAMLAEGDGRMSEAEDLYRRCLALEPRRHDIRNNLATLYLETGRAPLAGVELDRILQENPEDPDALKNMALLFWASDRERSKRLFRQYLEVAPEGPDRAAVERALRD